MIYYDKPWITIRWDESCLAVWAEWKNYVEGDDLRAGMDAGLALLRTMRTSRWLADTRFLKPVRQVDQAWANNDWFPRVLAAGLRWMAIVSPKSSVARLSVKQTLSKVGEDEMVTAYFDDIEDARAWLRNPTKSVGGSPNP